MAAVQILVYIGAIAILIIFAIMLTRRLTDEHDTGLNVEWPYALVVAVLALAILIVVIVQMPDSYGFWSLKPPEGGQQAMPTLPADVTKSLGLALLDPAGYVLPFEIASVLLLGAMVGAIVIARARKDD